MQQDSRSLAVISALVVGLFGRTASAQPASDIHAPESEAAVQRKTRTHDGFYLRLSTGGLWGGTSVAGDTPSYSTYTVDGFGFVVDAMAGDTLSSSLALGGVVSYQSFGQGGGSGTARLLNFGVFLDGFPMRNDGLHVGGMIGSSLSTTSAHGDKNAFRGMGPGTAAWLGYDGWVANEWAMGGMLKLSGNIAWGGSDEGGPDVVHSAATYEITLLFSVLYH